MIEDSFAIDQIERLEALPFFPRTAAGAGELQKALQQVARSESHAEKIIDEFLGSTCDDPRCPTPAEIIRTGWNLLGGDQGPKSNPECELCHGTGWIIIERGEISGADRCPCRPAPKAPEPVVAQNATTRGMRRVDARTLAAGGAE